VHIHLPKEQMAQKAVLAAVQMAAVAAVLVEQEQPVVHLLVVPAELAQIHITPFQLAPG
jgi:hypothetical protein